MIFFLFIIALTVSVLRTTHSQSHRTGWKGPHIHPLPAPHGITLLEVPSSPALNTSLEEITANQYHSCFLWSLLSAITKAGQQIVCLNLFCLLQCTWTPASLRALQAQCDRDPDGSTRDRLACWMLSPLTMWGRSGTSFNRGVASNGGGWSAIMSENHSLTAALSNRLLKQNHSTGIRFQPLPFPKFSTLFAKHGTGNSEEKHSIQCLQHSTTLPQRYANKLTLIGA